MTRNEIKTTVNVTRIEICDLMLACAFASDHGGEKWMRLHDKLGEQLKSLDEQIDGILEEYENFSEA